MSLGSNEAGCANRLRNVLDPQELDALEVGVIDRLHRIDDPSEEAILLHAPGAEDHITSLSTD
jgi:hypothetical protein